MKDKAARFFCSIAILIISCFNAHAQDIGFFRDYVANLLPYAANDFPARRGDVIQQNADQTTYKVWAPYYYLQTEAQYISVSNKTGQAFYTAVYTGNEIAIAEKVVTGFETNNPRSVFSYGQENFKNNPNTKKNADGYWTDTVYYKGTPVVVFNESPDEQTATITVGLFDSKNLSKAKALMPPMETKPYQAVSATEHLSVKDSIITVHGWGPNYDGDYYVAKLSKDSCISGNCETGKGRKILAKIINGQPRIRIMQGKFRRNVFLGNGYMLVDGEGPVTDGTYELGSFSVSYMHNTLEAKATFRPKRGDETYTGVFDGFLDDGIGAAIRTYKKFVVCEFRADQKSIYGPWARDVHYVNTMLQFDIYHTTDEFKQEEAKRLANNAAFDAIKSRNEATAKCGCCGGRGTTTQQDFVHFQASGNNYMRYSAVTCTCCGGTGLKKEQNSYKPKDNGGVIIK